MGVSHSGAELAAKFTKLAREYDDLPRLSTEDAALAVKKTVTKLAPSRLSGVGKRGAKLGVRYNLSGSAAEYKALIFATGPWQFIEADTKPHMIPALKGQKTRRDRAQRATKGRLFGPAFGGVVARDPIVIKGVGVRAHAFHPGTRGKHPWAKGVALATPRIRPILESRANAALHRVF